MIRLTLKLRSPWATNSLVTSYFHNTILTIPSLGALYTTQDAFNPYTKVDKRKKTDASFDEGSPRVDTEGMEIDAKGKKGAKPILKDANKPSLLKNVTIKDPKSKKKGKSGEKMGMSEP